MDKRLEKYIDENLRDVARDPIGLREYIGELEESLVATTDPLKRTILQGEIGVHLRSLGDLQEAERHLLAALQSIQTFKLGIDREIQQKIRLAHVYQWQKRFEQSDYLFNEVIATCRAGNAKYLDFALQHAGKNLFDQQLFNEALNAFKEAMSLRLKRSAPADQIESTALAIARVEQILSER